MPRPLMLRLLIALYLVIAGPVLAWSPTSEPGGEIDIFLEDWVDETRDGRSVPVKIYAPAGLDYQAPIVLFSHGLGGTREAAVYAGEHLASHGYVAVHIQHPGTDASILRGGANREEVFRPAGIDPEATIERFNDVPFVIDRLTEMNRTGHWAGNLDIGRIGMWGHSFGGVSAMAAAGQVFAGGGSAREPRIIAAGVFSPNAPGNGVAPELAYSQIKIPMLYITGTNDEVAPFGQILAHRRIAFDHVTDTDQYLVIFDGPDHSAWSGRAPPGERPENPIAREAVKAIGLAFWDAYLRDRADARAWLASDEAAALVPGGVYEVKQDMP